MSAAVPRTTPATPLVFESPSTTGPPLVVTVIDVGETVAMVPRTCFDDMAAELGAAVVASLAVVVEVVVDCEQAVNATSASALAIAEPARLKVNIGTSLA
jgi:hypothetical protein